MYVLRMADGRGSGGVLVVLRLLVVLEKFDKFTEFGVDATHKAA